MFKIAKTRIARWPVVIPVPGDDGKIMKYQAAVDFELLTTEEHDAIYAASGTDLDLLNRVVAGWADGEFEDENGSPLNFNEQSKRKLFSISYVRQAFVAAYLTAFNGRDPEKKNCPPPPATGRNG